MKRTLLLLNIFLLLFCALPKTEAQTQTVVNGSPTTAVNFPSGGCVYNWTNNTPGIGLPASGTGNISSFTAVNTGSTPVTATITATPAPAGFAYIANSASGTVSVINIATNLVVATITVGSEPSPISVSPDGSEVYVGNFGSGNVSVIDTKTNTVIATIDAISEPGGVAVSPDGTKVYVTSENPGMVPLPGTVSVINTNTNTLSTTITVGADPVGVTFSPDGNMAYVVNTNSNNVSVINTNSNTVVAVISVGHSPIDAAASPDGKFVYISNSFQGAVGTVSVINTATNTIVANITVGSNPYGLTFSPDGTKLYVSNNGSNTISVINTITNTVVAEITTPVDSSPTGISTSSDGNWLYAVGHIFDNVFVINTITNSIINTVPVGANPVSLGNFVTAGISCGGQPITFTITVNPTPAIPPTITSSTATGNISACAGMASTSPNIQQFTVSGSNLTSDITATAPTGFELSFTPGGGFQSTLAIIQTGGTATNTTVYVRSTAADPAGNVSGNVVLSSAGAQDQTVGVSGIVNALPTVNTINSQIVTNGIGTTAINFTGTANTFNWANDTPGIGLAASGTGNINSFTAINTGSTPITATITVTPSTSGGGGCTGTPIIFTIIVNPTATSPPIIITGTATGNISACVGEPSALPDIQQITVNGVNLTSDVTVTAPADFEVSLSTGSGYGSNITLAQTGGTIGNVIYVRSAASDPAGNISGNVTLTSTGAVSQNVAVSGIINALPIVNAVTNQSVVNGNSTAAINFTGTGSIFSWTNDTPGMGLAASGTGNIVPFIAINTGNTPVIATITVTPLGSESQACNGTPITFTITVNPTGVVLPAIVIPNTFTPNGDGINDVWTITALANYPQCTVAIFTRYGGLVYQSRGYPTPWDGTYKGAELPDGTYYYIIKPQPSVAPLAGYVTIIR